MNRGELIERLVDRHPEILNRQNCRQCIDRIREKIVESLKEGRRVEIRGFGSFFVRSYPERRFSNPRTNVKLTVPAHPVPRFKPGSQLRQELNSGSSRKGFSG